MRTVVFLNFVDASRWPHHDAQPYSKVRNILEEGTPTPWILRAARLELAWWTASGPLPRSQWEVFSHDFERVFCRLRISRGVVRECDVENIPTLRDAFGEDRFHYETLLTALRTVALFSNISGECLVSPHKWDDEEYEVPVWTRARPSFSARLVRVPYYSVLSKMVEARTAIYRAGRAPAWRQRIDKVFWRGDFTPSWTWCACDGSTLAPSNSPFTPPEARRKLKIDGEDSGPCRCRMTSPSRQNWEESPRLKVVNMSFHFPEDIDARFSKIFSDARDNPEWRGVLPTGDDRLIVQRGSDEMPLQYRYVLDVDGTTLSTDRPYSLLATGAVLFKQNSGIEPWLYSYAPYTGAELRPFEHFVPVAADLSDLRDRLRWARANPDTCEKIAARAAEWSSSWHRQEYAFEYIHHLFVETARLVV